MNEQTIRNQAIFLTTYPKKFLTPISASSMTEVYEIDFELEELDGHEIIEFGLKGGNAALVEGKEVANDKNSLASPWARHPDMLAKRKFQIKLDRPELFIKGEEYADPCLELPGVLSIPCDWGSSASEPEKIVEL
ncbi:hypothetical protein S40285_10395 [Stachybotrys chlorohalonatus IBT 40285]|uniref:Uncharacterized protein n=1 Tax=Stachybotrys chlorohalonatus (strain IBT 40285) TaxID=1283841 RepID=A0A084QPB7_STAC4|nr:hypothetical protein S40285_10395 [Stachybotrys chlorohalonata IBT 40285]